MRIFVRLCPFQEVLKFSSVPALKAILVLWPAILQRLDFVPSLEEINLAVHIDPKNNPNIPEDTLQQR
jgi:hypothetical protein